jgi:hypothetical protein
MTPMPHWQMIRGDRAWHYGEREAATLLKRMLAYSVSRFHPDPLAAIENAQKL